MSLVSSDISRGDTLIEVLFAISVFSLVVVGGLSIMNQGTAAAQRALEITLVRNEIDAQAEALRFMNASYIAAYNPNDPDVPLTDLTPAREWQDMVHTIGTTLPPSTWNSSVCPKDKPITSFIIDTKNAKFMPASPDLLKPAETFAQMRYDDVTGLVDMAQGIWIEAYRPDPPTADPSQSRIGYVDFTIRACWDSIGQSVPSNVSTLVRLYEPR